MATFKERVLTIFKSKKNEEYMAHLFTENVNNKDQLKFILTNLSTDIIAYTNKAGGQAYDVLESDPLAQRGALSRGLDVWSEVKRLNLNFYENRIEASKSTEYYKDDPYIDMYKRNTQKSRYEGEDWAQKVFMNDCLFPEGLESLNSMTHSLSEDYTDNSNGRFMRYEKIPFWQKTSHSLVDTDITETLGKEPAERGSHARGWDMRRIKDRRRIIHDASNKYNQR